MPPSLSSPLPLTTTTLLLLLLLLSTLLAVTSSSPTTFPNCTTTFSCGHLHNLTYPFTGAHRPPYCGPPQFRLTCKTSPELTTNSLAYRVLTLNPTQQTLVLSRSDLYTTTCSHTFANSTLDPTAFRYGTGKDLTLAYGCSALPNSNYTPTNMFSCVVGGVNSSDAFYFVGPLPIDPILRIIDRCYVIVTVPLSGDAAQRLTGNKTSLGEALREGFDVSYSNPYAGHCSNCSSIGGQCGFDDSLGEPICICGDRACPIPTMTGNNFAGRRGNLVLILGTVISTSGVLTILLLFIVVKKSTPSDSIVFRETKTENHRNIEAFLKNCVSLSPKRYTYSDIKKITNSFRIKLGQGGFGFVFKGELENGCLVAVKVLKGLKGNGDEFINEVATISRTSHVHIVTLLGFCFEGSHRALIYEYMCNGSLDKFIHDGGSLTYRQLGWDALYQIAIGIARGLEYLHRGCNTRILHFDIKPHNILLSEDFCPKISDFGLAKLCPQKESIISLLGARGTPGYIAPEVFSRNFGGVSHKSDVYSYGMMVLEMVGGRKNISVEVDHTSEIYFPHWVYKRLELDEELGLHGITDDEANSSARKMIIVGLWCIQTNPSHRPSMSRVLEMFEGSSEPLLIPPKPFLSSPSRAPVDSSTTLVS